MNYPSFVPTQWQATLLTMAVGGVAFAVNTTGSKYLSFLEGIILILQIAGFFAILIPLWILAPKVPTSEIFGSFSNSGGWPTLGTAIMVGQLTPAGALGGGYIVSRSFEPFIDHLQDRMPARTWRRKFGTQALLSLELLWLPFYSMVLSAS